ncbi:hypothetical protein ACJIZ3_008519 [Penstemon smallii]|uniref:Uncharacterized protein n=1 Tax=Penstemon smallii TaxID=265156 RepID=A0ABD3TB04_9LAMI
MLVYKKVWLRERSIGDSMQYQYVVLNMLERKAEDDIGCSSSTTNSKSPQEPTTESESNMSMTDDPKTAEDVSISLGC